MVELLDIITRNNRRNLTKAVNQGYNVLLGSQTGRYLFLWVDGKITTSNKIEKDLKEDFIYTRRLR